MEIKVVKIKNPENLNVIIGQSHFIKTVEDLYETLITSSPSIKFGIAFNESSGPRLIRYAGNDKELIELAKENAMNIGAGHIFVIFLKDSYPINVLNRVKMVEEVVRIFAASANPIEVIVAETEQGRGVLGVVDGLTPLGYESEEDILKRKEFLRKIGYKL
ncbi:MAG: adenosine-specific kinase [Caldisericia bacterium]|nr:adenosine-specific kinase [Caldisericia bacterium]